MPLLSLTMLVGVAALSSAMASSVVLQPMEHATWQLKSSAFHCHLEQHVSGLGQVTFIKEPNEALQLQLVLSEPYPQLKQVSVIAKDADWQHKESPAISTSYTAQAIKGTRVTFQDAALPLLQKLQAGSWLSFELNNHNNQQGLILTSLRGQDAVVQFQGCVAKMAPLSWVQARDIDIYFGAGQKVVQGDDIDTLKKLATYLTFDKKVKKILIDGYTDDVGSALANRMLSQDRADDVAAKLIELGVSANMLEVRAHGNRYPVVKNQGKSEQLHRRVSIRLIRMNS